MPERISPSGPQPTRRAVTIAQVGNQAPDSQKTLKTASFLQTAAKGLDAGGVLTASALMKPSATAAPSSTPSGLGADNDLDAISNFYSSLVGLSAGIGGGDSQQLVQNLLDAIAGLDSRSQQSIIQDVIHSLIDPQSKQGSNPAATALGWMVLFHYGWNDLTSGSWLNSLPPTLRNLLAPQQNLVKDYIESTFQTEDGYELQRASMQSASIMSFCFDISQPGGTLGGVRMAELAAHLHEGQFSIFSKSSLFGLIEESQESLDPAAVRGTCIAQLDTMAQQLGQIIKEIMPPAPDTSSEPSIDQNANGTVIGILYQYKSAWNANQWVDFAKILAQIYNATAPPPSPTAGKKPGDYLHFGNKSFTLTDPNGKKLTIPLIAWGLPLDAENSTDTAKLQAALTDLHNAIGNIDVYEDTLGGDGKPAPRIHTDPPSPNQGKPPVVKLSDLINSVNADEIGDNKTSNTCQDLANALKFTWLAADESDTSKTGGKKTFSPDALAMRLASALQGLNPMLANFSSSAQSSSSTLFSMSQSAYQQKQSVITSLLTTLSQIMNSIAQSIRSSAG